MSLFYHAVTFSAHSFLCGGALGNPLAFMLSFGNDHDSVHAVSLLSQFNIERNNILGDKACGAKAIREFHAYYSRAENINAFN
ncbi:hypothetical protein NE579_06880 [Intestinimonas massiliensis]|uniref:Transposase n=1 Tax=Intestinimonas massiliensis (ex Afouda et al. 2020) TaxID=1673721 RepID=A0AAW5JQL6_9FIRM|nr:hypothetical protein [Intestinimonas massiliensis (ex Afouda et al. 2020)]